jgi:hypothetical protein
MLVSQLALADGPTPSPTKGHKRAVAQVDENRCEGERPGLLVAASTDHDASTLWRLAMCDMQLRDWVAAVVHLRAYMGHADAKEDKRRLAQHQLLPSLWPRIGQISVAKEAAAVSIDGGPFADPSGSIIVLPGKHRLTMRREDQDVVSEVDVVAGEVSIVRFAHDAADTPAEHVTREPSAPIGTTTTMTGDITMTTTATLPPPSVSSVERDTRGVSRGRTIATIALGGAALAAAGAGVYLVFASTADSRSSTEQRETSHRAGHTCAGNNTPMCADAADLGNRAQVERGASVASFIGASAFAASALVTYFAWPSSPNAPRIGAAVGPRTASVGASVSF